MFNVFCQDFLNTLAFAGSLYHAITCYCGTNMWKFSVFFVVLSVFILSFKCKACAVPKNWEYHEFFFRYADLGSFKQGLVTQQYKENTMSVIPLGGVNSWITDMTTHSCSKEALFFWWLTAYFTYKFLI